jgi:hypothetical protein
MRSWTYTTDQGRDYAYGVAKYISDQETGTPAVIVGGAPATADLDTLPAGITPRRAIVVNADGVKRSVICFEVTAPLYATAGQAINLKDGGGVETSYAMISTSGERNRKRTVGV